MVKLTTCVLGTFALKNGRIIEKILFSENPEEIAKKLEEIEDSITLEEKELITKLAGTGIKKIHVNNPDRFLGQGFSELKINFVYDPVREDPYELGESMGISKKEIDKLMFKSNLELTKRKLRVVEKDKIIMQAVNAIDDIDEVTNRLIERLREWHSINFPELDHIVSTHKIYAQLIQDIGGREDFKKIDKYDESAKTTTDPQFFNKIRSAANDSFGAEFTAKDIEITRIFSKPINELYEINEKIEEYIEEMMTEIAPNITALAGALLGARLISLSGSLKRMSTLPASTIQILGAEDAFFKFLKTGKKPPKHGIIFQLPEIRGAPKKIRGKIARMFAAKLSIATKVDANNGKFMGDKLKEDFLKKVDKLNENSGI